MRLILIPIRQKDNERRYLIHPRPLSAIWRLSAYQERKCHIFLNEPFGYFWAQKYRRAELKLACVGSKQT